MSIHNNNNLKIVCVDEILSQPINKNFKFNPNSYLNKKKKFKSCP